MSWQEQPITEKQINYIGYRICRMFEFDLPTHIFTNKFGKTMNVPTLRFRGYDLDLRKLTKGQAGAAIDLIELEKYDEVKKLLRSYGVRFREKNQ